MNSKCCFNSNMSPSACSPEPLAPSNSIPRASSSLIPPTSPTCSSSPTPPTQVRQPMNTMNPSVDSDHYRIQDPRGLFAYIGANTRTTCQEHSCIPISGGSRNKAMGGAVILEGRHILERALPPPPPPPPPQGRRKVYMIGGLPKARIIKFMSFNGGHLFTIFLSSAGGGGGGGGGKKLHRAVFYGDRSKLFWMSLYKLITVYTRAISQAKNNNYTVVWLGGAEPPPPPMSLLGGGSRPPSPPPSAATAALTVPLPSTSHWVLNSGARHKLTFHASMHAVYNTLYII